MRPIARSAGFFLPILATLFVLPRATDADPPGKPSPSIPLLNIVIGGRGMIIVGLDTKTAPKTCAHIVALANKQFYDRQLFHSVVSGFVARTGDPNSKKVDGAKIRDLAEQEVATRYNLGGGGSGQTVPLEPGGIHLRGTLGMDRGPRVDSNDSRFFFNLSDNHSLDYAYTAFGKVIYGIEELPKPKPGEKQDRTMTLERGLKVMDSIKQGDRITSIRVILPGKPGMKK